MLACQVAAPCQPHLPRRRHRAGRGVGGGHAHGEPVHGVRRLRRASAHRHLQRLPCLRVRPPKHEKSILTKKYLHCIISTFAIFPIFVSVKAGLFRNLKNIYLYYLYICIVLANAMQVPGGGDRHCHAARGSSPVPQLEQEGQEQEILEGAHHAAPRRRRAGAALHVRWRGVRRRLGRHLLLLGAHRAALQRLPQQRRRRPLLRARARVHVARARRRRGCVLC